MESREVVIVGGGPAGVSAALFLAHARPDLTDKIVVLEKDTYPREKYCAGGLGGRADKALGAIGVRVAVPSVEINGISGAFQGAAMLRRSRGIGRVVRRVEFDHALALAARARGIDVRDGVRVTGIDWPEAGEAGVPAAFGESPAVVESSAGSFGARVVVGADGVGSIVRRAMGLPFGSVRAQVVEVDTEPAAADVARDLLHFDMSDRRYAGYSWDFPTIVDGRELVCRGTYALTAFGGMIGEWIDPEVILRERLAAMGLDLSRYRRKRFAERGFDAHLDLARPHALLIGEAAGIDPMLGEGIAQAIEYGALAGPYLAEKLDDGDLRFHDWTARLHAARLGKDLRLRAAVFRRYFGPMRGPIERYVLGVPAFMEAGMQYFAGEPISRAALLRIAAAGVIHTAKLGLDKLVR